MFGIAKRERRIEQLEQALASARLEVAELKGRLDALSDGFEQAEARRDRALFDKVEDFRTPLEERIAAVRAAATDSDDRLSELGRAVADRRDELAALAVDHRRLATRVTIGAEEVATIAAALIERIEGVRRQVVAEPAAATASPPADRDGVADASRPDR